MSHVKISEPKDDKKVFTLPVGIPINVPDGVHEPETKGPTKRTKIGDQNEKIWYRNSHRDNSWCE